MTAVLLLVADNGRLAHRYKVVPGERWHVWDLAHSLRQGELDEIAAQGLGPYTCLSRTFRGSLWAETAFIDGKVAAMWGLGGNAFDNFGIPWLMTTALVEKLPVAVVKEAKKATQKMLDLRPVLSNHVLASYRGACRLLEVIGFTLDEPKPYGPKGTMFRRFHMER
jgi:hypothetical protein